MKKMRKMRIFQKDSYISIDFLDKKTEIIKLKSPSDLNTFTFDIETNNGKKTISISAPVIPAGNAIREELESFTSSIVNNTPTAVNEMDGFRAMEVAHQVLDKIRKNQIV